MLLAVEVSTPTVRKDMKLKAALYAQFGIREYWVVNTKTLTTTVHKAPTDGVWGSIETLPAEAVLTHASAPGFAIRLADI